MRQYLFYIITAILGLFSCNHSIENEKGKNDTSHITETVKKDLMHKKINLIKKLEGLKYYHFEIDFYSHKLLINSNNDVEIIYQYADNIPITKKGKLVNNKIVSEYFGEVLFDENELCVYNPEIDSYECYNKISESNLVFDEIMTFKDCSCGAHDCGLIFKDSEGNTHEFYQNILLKQIDFKCSEKGTKYKNKKFRIKYAYDETNQIDELISIRKL